MELPVKIVKDSKYADMYRLQWENGDLSKDCYNYSWACEHLRTGGVNDLSEFYRKSKLAKKRGLPQGMKDKQFRSKVAA